MTQARLKVTSKGQITLRKEMLKQLGVRPGDTLTVSVEPSGGLWLKPAPQESVEEFLGSLTNGREIHLTIDDINEITRKGWAGEL